MIERKCDHFGDDIDQSALIRQLGCLQDAKASQIPQETAKRATITTVISCLRRLGLHVAVFSEVAKLLKLFLLLPACQ